MANFNISASSLSSSIAISKIVKQEQNAITKAKQLLVAGSDISYIAQVTGLSIQTLTILKQSEGT